MGFFISENGHDNSNDFTELFLGWNELIHIKHFADLLTLGKHLIVLTF